MCRCPTLIGPPAYHREPGPLVKPHPAGFIHALIAGDLPDMVQFAILAWHDVAGQHGAFENQGVEPLRLLSGQQQAQYGARMGAPIVANANPGVVHGAGDLIRHFHAPERPRQVAG